LSLHSGSTSSSLPSFTYLNGNVLWLGKVKIEGFGVGCLAQSLHLLGSCQVCDRWYRI